MWFRRKDKAMATTTEVNLPEPTRTDVGDWQFPEGWSDEDIRDWLATHPEGRPQVETITIVDHPDLPPPDAGDYDSVGLDDTEAILSTPLDELEDRRVSEEDDTWTDEDEARALKADGVYAAAFALPMELQDSVTSENYDPRQFFLVHLDVWNSMIDATVQEAQLGLENKELRKRVNALTRGMRKVNKHWSATKRDLKWARRANDDVHKAYRDLATIAGDSHREELKKQSIFTTRLARRLRKARAGRDKRERQLNQANAALVQQERIIESQHDYIKHLETLLNGRR